MARLLRIVHVLAPARYGGLERVVELLALAQHTEGNDVHVIVSIGTGGEEHPLTASLRRGGVGVNEIRVPSRAYFRERRELHALITALAPDVVHSHGFRSDVLVGTVAPGLGLCTVSTAHGFVGGGMRGRAYEWLQRRIMRSCSAIVAVSRPLIAQLQESGIARDRIHFVPNAWVSLAPPLQRAEARQVLGLPMQGVIIGWVGRLSSEKGPDVMLEALADLPNEPQALLAMVGAGRELSALQGLAARLGVTDRIRWVGEVPDAPRVFRAFDAFVLSSRTEGTPMVLLEAMEAGVPIVATRVGGVGDVIGEYGGLLVPPSDPGSLSTAIRSVLLDRGAAQHRAAQAAIRLVRDFGVERWLSSYRRVYDAAISGYGGGELGSSKGAGGDVHPQ